MSGQKLVSFEVYYLQGGRWQIHARFGPNDREQAIEEAKRLDTGGFEASCVIREAFSQATNESEESVAYYTPTLKTRPPVAHITGGAGGGSSKSGWSGDAPPEGSAAANAIKDAKKREREFNKKQKAEAAAQAKKNAPPPRKAREPVVEEKDAIGEVVFKVFLVCLISLIPAGLISYASFHSIAWAREQDIFISVQAAQFTLIAVFILSFAAFFVPMLRKYVTFGTKEPVVEQKAPARPLIDKIVPVRDQDGLEPSVALDEPISLDDVDAANLEVLEMEQKARKTEAPVYEADPDLPPEEAQVAGELAITPVHGDGDPESMSNELERMELEARRVVGPEVDDYTRFGLTLFFAGAGEALSRKFKIIGKAAMDVMVKRVMALGNTEKLARGFIANIEEYLLEDRYFGMYRRGRSAAYRRIVDPNAPLGLDEALAEWRKPTKQSSGEPAAAPGTVEKQEQQQTGEKFVAVFFTDIVDSTAKQQKNGDHWMMDVIRAHNEIVREGIKKHGGREIKHTGDGIMATFPGAQNAVEASILMQRGFKRFCSVMPDRGFEVRVGISAGEPIHESGDIFGTPVNLAARVLSKTDPNQICVSSIVKDLCQGKGYKFDPHGTFELKGFPEAQVIYQVVYSVPDAVPLTPVPKVAGTRSVNAGARPRVAA